MSYEIWLFLLPAVRSQLNPNSVYPPHGCMNFGLCTKTPSPNISELTCESGNCYCMPGTTGPLCEEMIDLCYSNPCSAEQDCVTSFNQVSCVCKAGFTGADCLTPMTSICATEPCLNGGICMDTGAGNFICACKDGYTGTVCKYKDPCNPNPCHNGGTCVSLWDYQEFYCECPVDWIGIQCGARKTTFDLTQTTLVGCFGWDNVVNDGTKFLSKTDNKMTSTACRDFQMSITDPIYNFYVVMGKTCYISTKNFISNNQLDMNDNNCRMQCPGAANQMCGNDAQGSRRMLVYRNNVKVIDENECETNKNNATANCLGNSGDGFCVNMAAYKQPEGYWCLCKSPEYTGSRTSACKPAVDPCEPNPCKRNTTCVTDDYGNYECLCPDRYSGDRCQYINRCYNSPCKNGGTCIDNEDGTYTCQCLPMYQFQNCTEIDICLYAQPCVHGTCSDRGSGYQIYPRCKCDPGWKGTYCDKERDLCSEKKPCKNNDTCIPSFNDYTCVCTLGFTGKDCEINIDDCVPYTDENGQVFPNRCMTKDPGAICIDGVNSLSCNCSSSYTMEYCDLHVVIRDVLLTIYGEVNTLLIPMLEDLMKTPAMIKDLVPFIIGTLDAENRTALSWKAEDLFNWADFEEHSLNYTRDLVTWNDVVLGNCFTFNRFNANQMFIMRSSSKKYGFYAQMRVREDELLPWYETAAMMVFVHDKDEYVFSESVRYNAEPNSEVNLYVSDAKYTRLGGVYGRCVNDPAEVKAYYYEGSYSTDGCLRSCYQDMIEKRCGCMDPRYPMKQDATACKILDMTCIEESTLAEGDPSTWSSCQCPLSCSDRQYRVMWDKANYVADIPSCQGSNKTPCEKFTKDTVQIQVSLPALTYSLYAENPKMDLNKFIASLGGLLGVLMGVSIISFIEFVIIVVHLVKVIAFGK